MRRKFPYISFILIIAIVFTCKLIFCDKVHKDRPRMKHVVEQQYLLPVSSIDKAITREILVKKVADLADWCGKNEEYASQSILLTLQGSLLMNADTLLVKFTAEYSRLMLEQIGKKDKSKI